MVYILTIVAALVVGLGTVVEQRAAAQAPPEYNLSLKLLVWLVQRRLWLLGVGCSLVGNILFAFALGSGSVALVEAVYTLRLLFALTIASAWWRYRVRARDIGGALAISAGLAGFVLAARPQAGAGDQTPELAWLVSGGAFVVFVLVMTLIAVRMGPLTKATLLGAGGGALFGLQASLTHVAVQTLLQSGPLALATTWQGYAVVATALTGMLLVQSAYEAAPLSASYPAIVTTQLLGGIALGVFILGGSVERGAAELVAAGVMLMIMVVGIYLLTTSPLLTGQLDQLMRQQEAGHAVHIESRLRRELARADNDAQRAAAQLAEGQRPPASGRRLRRELSRVEAGIGRLERLQTDIRRHREIQRTRIQQQSGDLNGLAEQDRRQQEQERSIDESAGQLRETADALIERWGTAADHGSSG